MREIKFRCWLPDIQMMNNWESGVDGGTKQNIEDYLDDPESILMQYTGLKDKNGKEIYEGDVVTGQYTHYDPCRDEYLEDEKMGGVVFYDHHHYSLKVVQSLCDKERDGMVNYFDFIDEGEYWAPKTFDEMVVIGNIYENPELLQDPISSNER